MEAASSAGESVRVERTTRAARVLARTLVGLCWLTGVTAAWGGIELMRWRHGAQWLPPLALLEHTPFSSYFVPGLLLAGVVGLVNLAAGVLVWWRHRWGALAGLAAGVTLTTWIVVEPLLLRTFEWLHGLYLAIGVATLAVAEGLRRRQRRSGSA